MPEIQYSMQNFVILNLVELRLFNKIFNDLRNKEDHTKRNTD